MNALDLDLSGQGRPVIMSGVRAEPRMKGGPSQLALGKIAPYNGQELIKFWESDDLP